MSRLSPMVFALLAAGFALVAPGPAGAQKKKAAPPPAGPPLPKSYPTLSTPTTLGGRPGASAAVPFADADRERFAGGWLSCGGATTADAVAVPADAPLGVHLLRAATRRGPTNLRPFTVDSLPAVAEAATPSTRSEPQAVPNLCVVVGTADAERSDYYRVPASTEPLTVEVLARRLGSSMDPVVLIHDGAGRERPGLYADDTPGLQGDCRLTFTPGPTGAIVEVRDTAYRGGPEYGYRLRLGRFPAATAAFPLAVERAAGDSVGWTSVAPGPMGWPLPRRLHPWPESAEREPNDTMADANPLPVPGGVSARFAGRGDVDRFRVAARKGWPLLIRAAAAEFGAPTELLVRILDAAGTELMRSDPQQQGARLEFRPGADGDYVVVCEPLSFQHGPDEVYHLSAVPLAGECAVTLGLDRTEVPAGGVGFLPVTAASRDGKAAVELLWHGDGRVSASAVFPAGREAKPDAPFWVPLTAPAGATPGLAAGELLARPVGGTYWRPAAFPDIARAAFGGLAYPPPGAAETVAVAVVPPLPYTVAATLERDSIRAGQTLRGEVTVRREPAFDGELFLDLSAPPGWTAELPDVPKGADRVAWKLTAPKGAPAGPAAATVYARRREDGPAVAAAVRLRVE